MVLVRMQNGTVPLENSYTVSYEVEYILTMRASEAIPIYLH